MCCFSQPVQDVSRTRIFARMGSSGANQLLAYSMHLDTKDPVAMILPLPVAKGTKEDAVKFINLEKYPELFDDLWAGFPRQVYRGSGTSDPFSGDPPQTLKVVGVGAYEASFVPTIADFARVDERFRLPDNVWAKLPSYADYGFAVFKLKAGKSEVHPMAFSFPTADAGKLFFPTLHIHDGEIHAKEEFDHTLYCQGVGVNPKYWDESPGLARSFVKPAKSQWVVHPDRHVYRLQMKGLLDNGDVTAKVGRVTF